MNIRVSELNIYPLKAAKGISLREAEITPIGLRHDRIALLIHEGAAEGDNIITQRTRGCEKLALVAADMAEDDCLRIAFPNSKSVTLLSLAKARAAMPGDRPLVGIWGQKTSGFDAGDDAASVFSEYLGLPCRLILYPFQSPRPVKPPYAGPGDIVSFADGAPLHITALASLQSLQAHFEDSSGGGVTMARFRPNIVLDGTLPFEEDVIHRLRIGEAELEILKPCERCKVTTIDQQKGIEEGPEPLASLRSLRRGKAEGLQGFFFGSDAAPRKTGIVRVGDEVEILARRPAHPALSAAKLGFGRTP